MKLYFLWLFLFFKEISSENKLNVDVLFESLCPDSIRFIREQLYPHWKELAPYINLKLVPFGKSVSLENGTQFLCQHGPKECKGNRILSCALKTIPHQNLQIEFVNCFMDIFKKGSSNNEEFGEVCATGIGINFTEIMECYSSREGTLIQLKAELDTSRISPKFVPTILFNEQFNQQLQDESLTDFKSVSCKLLAANGVSPETCLKASKVVFI